MTSQNKLSDYIKTLESHIPLHKFTNPKVSKATIGWQIDHSLKVINGIIEQLKEAPTDKKPRLTMLGRFCLFTNYIPRGKGKAPKQVLPPENIEKHELQNQLETSKKLLPQLQNIDNKATFKHPYFGILTKKQTLKFLGVHTKHHLKIITDVLK